MYEISVVSSIDAIGAEVFAELEGPASYPFLRYTWLDAFEKSGCLGRERGWLPRHLVLKHNGTLLAVCPAYLKTNSMGEFVFDQQIAEFAETRLGLRYYPKLILAVPFTPASGPRVLFRCGVGAKERRLGLGELARRLPALCRELGVSSLHILFPESDSLAPFVEAGWSHRLGLQFQFENPGYPDFDAFLEGFRAKRRAAIRRERRELAERPLEIVELRGEELRRLDARLAHELYLTTVDKFVWGRRYLTRPFFERVLADMPDAIHFVLASDAKGEPIAGAFNLLGEHALYGRYWGAFREVPFLHFEVCLYRGVEATIRSGRARFEPGAGGEHKESRGFAATPTHSLHYFEDPRLAQAVREYFAREAEQIVLRSGK